MKKEEEVTRDIKFKEVLDAPQPSLVASEEQQTSQSAMPIENQNPTQTTSKMNGLSSEVDSTAQHPGITDGVNASKTIKKVAIGAMIVIGALGLGRFVDWYVNAPRIPRGNEALLTPAVYAALAGDADVANALVAAPSTFDDITSIASRNYELGVSKQAPVKDSKGNPVSDARKAWLSSEHQRSLAYANIDRFLSQQPAEKTFSILNKGVSLSLSGQMKEAADVISPLGENTVNPFIKNYYAIYLGYAGEQHRAFEQINKALELADSKNFFMGDSNSQLFVMKSQLLMGMGRPEEAVRLLSSPRCDPKSKSRIMSDRLLFTKASAYLQMNEPDKAIVLACQSSHLNHSLLAMAYLMKEDLGEATNQAQADKRSRPLLASIYAQQGRQKEALELANFYDKKSPTLMTREQHIYLLNRAGHYKQALSVSDGMQKLFAVRSLAGAPAWNALHGDRAYAFAKLGDRINAMREAETALRNNPFCRSALEAAYIASTGEPLKAAQFKERLDHLPYPEMRPVHLDFEYTNE